MSSLSKSFEQSAHKLLSACSGMSTFLFSPVTMCADWVFHKSFCWTRDFIWDLATSGRIDKNKKPGFLQKCGEYLLAGLLWCTIGAGLFSAYTAILTPLIIAVANIVFWAVSPITMLGLMIHDTVTHRHSEKRNYYQHELSGLKHAEQQAISQEYRDHSVVADKEHTETWTYDNQTSHNSAMSSSLGYA